MADVSQVLNALTGVVYQVNSAIHPGAPNPYAPPGPAPGVAPYQMPQDTWSGNRPPAPPTPAAVQTASTGGVMGVLQSLFSAIANFFRRLFGGANQPAAPSTGAGTTAWPATNLDARDQLFQMIPTGNGTVIGFVPINVTRYADRIVASAAGFGGAAVVHQGSDYVFYENNQPGVRVKQVTSQRSAAGDTHFDITLDTGKSVAVDLLADGHTLRYKNYQVTIG